MSDPATPVIHSQIWHEEAEDDDPFAARACYCRGYDVYGDVLGQASFAEYLYLLFRGERPSPASAAALEILAIALANPGPRDPSVHAAMSAGVGGSPAAACLIAALAVGAGSYGGGREVRLAMEGFETCGEDLDRWQQHLANPPMLTKATVWPAIGHPPGFEPYAPRCRKPVVQTLDRLRAALPEARLGWFANHREDLESAAGRPVAMSGVAAATLSQLGFSADQGEMLVLLLRLPGAAAHALEQAQRGIRNFPFFALELTDDPATREVCA